MSIARINTVKSARKDQGTCDKCGTPLPAGSAYRWYTVGFRSHFKRRRCMQPACTPRPSELESSLVASIYAAQEDAEEIISAATSADEIESAIDEVVSAIREVAEQYREAAVNPNTGVTFNYESEERADTLDSSADDLEGHDVDVDDGCGECEGQGEIDCPECSGQGQVDDPDDDEAEEQVDCDECSGSGTIDCEECDGTGEFNMDEAREAALEAINGIEV